jgi:hypothetical protein
MYILLCIDVQNAVVRSFHSGEKIGPEVTWLIYIPLFILDERKSLPITSVMLSFSLPERERALTTDEKYYWVTMKMNDTAPTKR